MREQVCRTIRTAVPAAGEAISYAMPTITLNGRDLVSFAAWKRHIGLYPLPAMMPSRKDSRPTGRPGVR